MPTHRQQGDTNSSLCFMSPHACRTSMAATGTGTCCPLPAGRRASRAACWRPS